MNNRLSFTFLLRIGIGIAILAIPQILFFWLAPEAECQMTVYAFMTVYTLFHTILCIYLRLQKSMRIVAPLIQLSTGFAIVELVACTILLAADVTRITATYTLVIIGLIHFIFTAILLGTLER